MRRVLFAIILLSLAVSVWLSQRRSSSDGATVYLIQAAPPNMLELLNSGEIDGFVAWEPYNAQAVLNGLGKYLLKSADIWDDHPCCVLAVSGNISDPLIEEALVWAHIKATRFIQSPDNHNKVVRYTMEFSGSSQEVAKKSLKNTIFEEFPDKDSFREYYNQLKQGGLLKGNYRDIGYETEDNFFSDLLRGNPYAKIVDKLTFEPDWRPTPVSAQTTVRLGYIAGAMHHIHVHIAEKEGYFFQVGLVPGKNLEFRSFANGVAIMDAFRARELDVAYLGGAPATLKRINDNIKIRILAEANREGSAIVVGTHSGINSMDDLNGKTIAVPGFGTVQHFLLERVLKKEKLIPVIK